MTDEIKEILDNMKEISSFEYTTDWFELNYEDIKLLLDYITNLQQELEEENERLKENAIHNDKVVDKAKWNEMIYKSRCEKAIEYIKEHRRKDEFLNLNEWQTRDLLNILQNGSEDNETIY